METEVLFPLKVTFTKDQTSELKGKMYDAFDFPHSL